MENMKKFMAVILAVTLFCLSLVGCGNTTSKEENQTRTVVDMTGNTIEVPQTVDKVFVDWASGITLVMTLGATDKLVVAPTAFETDTFAWARIICPAIDNVEKCE